MRFAVFPNLRQPWGDVLAVARHVDETGWDGLYVPDHFMPDEPDFSPGRPPDMHESWSALAALAPVTSRLRLGTLVSAVTHRHPAVLLNQAVTIDHASGGRAVVGLGGGWQESEHRAYGIPFFSTGERLARLDEACTVIKLLTSEELPSFDGRYYRLERGRLVPPPVGPLPLLVGGAGERVTLRIAARHADEWNTWGDAETMTHKQRVLDRHCEELGRDPGEIRRSAQSLLFLSDDEHHLERVRSRDLGMPTMIGTAAEVREIVARYEQAGVDELIVPDFTLGSDLNRRFDVLDEFLEEVAAPFRRGER